jgi:hypothetical protein
LGHPINQLEVKAQNFAFRFGKFSIIGIKHESGDTIGCAGFFLHRYLEISGSPRMFAEHSGLDTGIRVMANSTEFVHTEQNITSD